MSEAVSISDLNARDRYILVGSDPEVFLTDTGGRYVSAIGRFNGTKEEPVAVKSLGKGYAVQVDNVLLEYNTPPAKSATNWLEAHRNMLQYLRSEAAKQNLLVSIDASAVMPDSELQHPAARVFGCSPDFNAWEMRINNPPRANDPNLRSAGGHIHVGGISKFTNLQKVNVVRAMDMLVGSLATLVDTDERRKELYGRPGAMRFKDYGVEYRTVSNFWLKSESLMQAVYGLTTKALTASTHRSFTSQAHEEDVLRMFKHNDKALARDLMMRLGVRSEEYV